VRRTLPALLGEAGPRVGLSSFRGRGSGVAGPPRAGACDATSVPAPRPKGGGPL
jgi:hypothetical protein